MRNNGKKKYLEDFYKAHGYLMSRLRQNYLFTLTEEYNILKGTGFYPIDITLITNTYRTICRVSNLLPDTDEDIKKALNIIFEVEGIWADKLSPEEYIKSYMMPYLLYSV